MSDSGANPKVRWWRISDLRITTPDAEPAPPPGRLKDEPLARRAGGPVLDPPGRRGLWAAVDLRMGGRWRASLHLPREAAGGGPTAEDGASRL